MFKIARNTIYSTLAVAIIAGAAPASIMLSQPVMAQAAGGGGGGGGGGSGTGGNGNEANPALSFILSRAQVPGSRGAAPSDTDGQGCHDASLRPDRCYTGAPLQRP